MTRINCVPVTELYEGHLICEYEELPRIYKLALKALQRGEDPATHGDTYVRGTGHVRFFYSRLGYIVRRQAELALELGRRNITYTPEPVPRMSAWPASWLRDWSPTFTDMEVNRSRMRERKTPPGGLYTRDDWPQSLGYKEDQ